MMHFSNARAKKLGWIINRRFRAGKIVFDSVTEGQHFLHLGVKCVESRLFALTINGKMPLLEDFL